MSHVLQTQNYAYKDGLVLDKYRVQSQAEQMQQEGKRVTDVAKVCLICLALCLCTDCICKWTSVLAGTCSCCLRVPVITVSCRLASSCSSTVSLMRSRLEAYRRHAMHTDCACSARFCLSAVSTARTRSSCRRRANSSRRNGSHPSTSPCACARPPAPRLCSHVVDSSCK